MDSISRHVSFLPSSYSMGVDTWKWGSENGSPKERARLAFAIKTLTKGHNVSLRTRLKNLNFKALATLDIPSDYLNVIKNEWLSRFKQNSAIADFMKDEEGEAPLHYAFSEVSAAGFLQALEETDSLEGLTFCYINDEMLAGLCSALLENKSLKSLSLRGAQISQESAMLLANTLVKHPKIDTFSMTADAIVVNDMEAVFTQKPSLRDSDIQSTFWDHLFFTED